tara:strand:- start:374 stop:2779 length:2406 start_codon:yes stop_codon:yes gene_type:complete
MKIYVPIILIVIFISTYFFKNRKKKNITKTYYLPSTNNYLVSIFDQLLKNRNWKKLQNIDLNYNENIGFIMSDLDKQNVLKSNICYGFYFENLNLLSSNIYYSKYFNSNDYFPTNIILKKNDVISNINILYNSVKKLKSKLFILKDVNNNKFKIIFKLSNNNSDNITNKLKLFPSNFLYCHEYFDSIKFSIPEININDSNIINYYNKKNIKRSLTKFFILVICKNNIFEFYKINSFLNYLCISPINDDINNLSSYFINYIDRNSNKDLIKIYENITQNNKYPSELFSELYCISNKHFKKQKLNEFKVMDKKIEAFINDFANIFYNQFICINDIFFNKNFISCFNIFTIDSIFTENNDLKILKIDNNFSNVDFSIFKYNKNIINFENIFNDILKNIEYNYKNSNELSLVTIKNKNKINKVYYLSDFQIKAYPEIVNLLKKRNYNRSMWKKQLNSNNNIDLYIGYTSKDKNIDENNKKQYLNHLHKFYNSFNITNKIEGSIYKLGDKSTFYNQLKNTNLIADFVNFSILKNSNNESFIKTSELLKIQNFIVINQTTCNRFILKPSLGSQGDGIEIIRYFEDFEKWIKTPKKYIEWSICEFLEPKLFNSLKIKDGKKRKAHIRSYFIIVNHKNTIKIYELKHRILYFAVDKYISKCVKITPDNKYSFITNLALASEERNIQYDTMEFTDDLLNYQDQIFNFRKLSKTLTEYGLKCISLLSDSDFKCFSKKKSPKNCYQILAIDYLPINKNQVKILEVNKGPGFKALKMNFNLDQIFDEIFKITIDLFNENKSYDNELKLLNRLI